MIVQADLQVLQQEVNLLSGLQVDSEEAVRMNDFICGAISALAWVGGREITPSTLALLLNPKARIIQ